MKKRLDCFSFKSKTNCRITLIKRDDGNLEIHIQRIIPKEEIDRFPSFNIKRTFSKCYLITQSSAYLEETMAHIMLFMICQDIKDHRNLIDLDGWKFNISKI